jgi:membrane protein DedA with SNARE-associated domain
VKHRWGRHLGILHVGIGYLAGNSYAKVEHYVGRATWFLLVLIVGVGVTVHFIRRRRNAAGKSPERTHA